MGRKVIDICMDKEPDPAVVYSNGNCNEQGNDQHELLESDEQIKGDLQVVEENNEIKDYEVKECTAEYPVEINDHMVKNDDATDEEVLCNKSTNFEAGLQEEKKAKPEIPKPVNSKKLNTAAKPGSRFAAAGNTRSNVTVPQPFSLATDKRASHGARPLDGETENVGGNGRNNLLSSNGTKKPPSSPLMSRKPLQLDDKKHNEEEDTHSIASSCRTAASVRTIKYRTTVGSAPTFRSSERAAKRKEFYSKLEEKHQALEAEKTQCEARTKEERDAAIKQLRKSLAFKAKPMPSFYHEGPPPKVELKKVPTTRAISPKLGRRKSCSDAVNSAEGDNTKEVCGRVNRHSMGSYKKDNASPAIKDQISGRNGNTTPKVKKESKPAKEANKSLPPKIMEPASVDIAVQS